MAVDTAGKRASALGFGAPFRLVAPTPDGSLADTGDRQHVAYSYRGIAAGSPVAPPTPPTHDFTLDFTTTRGFTLDFGRTRNFTIDY
jgi:hypothetical protein